MTQWSDQLNSDTATAWLKDQYQIPALLLLASYMLWTRLHGWSTFVSSDQVLFSGNDAWYHYRQVTYTVANFPQTIPFDPWTSFPTGTAAGQFGTLYDQIVATVALVLGAGSPTEQTIGLTLLFTPAVLGTLVIIPTYLLGRHFGGRLAGICAVVVLALTPGAFLQRTMVGFSDHHAAETLFQAFGMLAVMLAVQTAEREKPVFEVIQAREFQAVKKPFVRSILAGIAVALYVSVWPPGVVIAFILAVFYGLHLTAEFIRNRSPEHVALQGIISSLVTALILLVPMSTLGLSSTDFSLLQPLLFVLVAVGLTILATLARFIESRSLPTKYYPGILGGGTIALALLVRVIAPTQFEYFVSQFYRIFGYDASASARTIGEAQPIPLDSVGTFMLESYGLAFLAAVAGAVLLITKYLRAQDSRGSNVALVVWFALMTMATLTQVRFDYYLIIPVAVLTGVCIAWVSRKTGLQKLDNVRNISAYQVIIGVLIVSLLVGPFVSSIGASGVTLDSTAVAESNQPGEVTAWEGSLAWIQSNTPSEGTYGNPNATALSRQATVSPTADYKYPSGAYGVVSWWDYGHFITTLGERIPVANPFQQGSTTAADFLLSSNETAANDFVTWDDEQAQYVMLDWKLTTPGSEKYTAPTAFTTDENLTSTDLVEPVYQSTNTSIQFAGYIKQQQHYDSLRVRLYQYHGSAVDTQPTVVDWETQQVQTSSGDITTIATTPSDGQFIKQFENMTAAEAYVQSDRTSQIGGASGLPSDRIPALEHYRLVHASDSQYSVSTLTGISQGSWVKTFERVPGAEIDGRAPANSTVTASIQLSIPNQNSTFTYTQQAETGADGEFTMTLPYSTTGYENWGVDAGYTNVSVQATGPYSFSLTNTTNESTTAATTIDVPEAKVIGEDTTAINVTLSTD